MWECEAFGIPDVDYQWLRNSEILSFESLTPDEQARYEIVVSTSQLYFKLWLMLLTLL